MNLLACENLIAGCSGTARSAGVSFILEQESVIWIKGPSGGGKTTLLRTLARLAPVVGGDMFLEGVPWNQVRSTVWRTRVSYFHQKSVLFPGTVLSNLQKPFAFTARTDRFLDIHRAEDYLSRLLFGPAILDRDALTLSVGESSRVALVRGLMADPQVLLLDEPSAALDPRSNEALASILNEWLSGGCRGIIATAHDREIIRMLPGAELTIGLECTEGDAPHLPQEPQ